MTEVSHKVVTTPSPAPDAPPWAAGVEGRMDELYPRLSEDETKMVLTYGDEVLVSAGTRLWEVGERNVAFYLVLDGQMDILRRDEAGEHIVYTHERGGFSGETVTMTGRGAFVAGAAKSDLRAVKVSNELLRDLLAVEAELGEKILQAFILRRMNMISKHLGDIIIVGDETDKQAAGIREFLSRNAVPYAVVDASADAEADRRKALDAETCPKPLVICGHTRLSQPTIKEVADCLGLTAELPADASFDVAVIGGGPAGLAAAVYSASEGLDVVVLEKCAIGGQAGSSSRIENYLGFPTGISGQALTGRGFLQAQKFGAEVAVAQEAAALTCGSPFHHLTLDCGGQLKARAVVIASGAIYRQPDIEGLEKFEGVGVHYGASHIQGMMCRDQHVVIVGGGNSAGQAAVYLSGRARKVSILIRRDNLADTMSQYLIRRIESTPNIELVVHTEVQRLEGESGVERIHVRNNQSGEDTAMDATHLFLFIGAKPASDFLEDRIIRDEKGFVRTGDTLTAEHLETANWPFARKPFHLETSCPGVFAVGDIRSGSIKRVASAVGDGSVCVSFVHSAIAESQKDKR